MFCVTSFDRVSAEQLSDEYYISSELGYNPDFLHDGTDGLKFGKCISITVSKDHSNVNLEIEYEDVSYTCELVGYSKEQCVSDVTGYVGAYKGFIESTNDQSNKMINIDLTTVFTSNEIYAIICVGTLTENQMPDIALYGIVSEILGNISTAYSEKAISENNDGVALTSLESAAEVTNSTALDMSISYRGQAVCKIDGYELFNVSSFHQRNLINGSSARIRAKCNTSTDSFVQYMRNVQGYNNVSTKGYALSAIPEVVNLSIGGYHTDFTLMNNGCSPISGQIYLPLTIPYYTETVGFNTININLLLSKVSLSLSEYVNGCTDGYNIANWEIYSNSWDSDTLDGNYSTDSGVAVSADMAYYGSITQNVGRYIVVEGSVVYAVYIQSPTATVAMMVTTEEICVTTIMFVYPATSG